jgi:AraC-like DNA-binding protein
MLGAHARLRLGAAALDYDVGLHRSFRVVAERREGTIWDTRLATPNAGVSERAVVMILLEGSVTWHGPDGFTLVGPSAYVAAANDVEGTRGRWPRTFRSEGSPFSTMELQVARTVLHPFDHPAPFELSAGVLAAARAHVSLVHGPTDARALRAMREETTRALFAAAYADEVLTSDLTRALEPPTKTDELLWSLLAPLVEDFDILPSLDTTGAPAGLSARQLTRRLDGFLSRLELPWGGWREVTRGYRLKVAVMLLSSEELAIAEIARRCGYSSAEALAHALTTEGLPPPNELRRRIVGNLG